MKSNQDILLAEIKRHEQKRDELRDKYESGVGSSRTDEARMAQEVIMEALQREVDRLAAEDANVSAWHAARAKVLSAKQWDNCWQCPRRAGCVMADRLQRIPTWEGGLGLCPILQEVEHAPV